MDWLSDIVHELVDTHNKSTSGGVVFRTSPVSGRVGCTLTIEDVTFASMVLEQIVDRGGVATCVTDNITMTMVCTPAHSLSPRRGGRASEHNEGDVENWWDACTSNQPHSSGPVYILSGGCLVSGTDSPNPPTGGGAGITTDTINERDKQQQEDDLQELLDEMGLD